MCRSGRRVLALGLLLCAAQTQAMTPLDDAQMADVSGAGLAFVLDDFRFQMAPTSFIEQIGSPVAGGTRFQRGDLRWFGLTLSGIEGTGQPWSSEGGHACGSGLNGMGCPMTRSGIRGYATHNNPLVLRVFEYHRIGWQGQWAADVPGTVLELIGPTAMEPFYWSFWGETQTSHADGTAVTGGILQNQSIIRGRPSADRVPGDASRSQGPVLRLFQDQRNSTLGLSYHHALSGDYRFSVHQIADGADSQGVPRFTDTEGLYFRNVNTFLPLGQMHYQSVVLDAAASGDGNFVIELTPIPDQAVVYDDFYAIGSGNGYDRRNRPDRYYETHGYVRWGNGFPSCSSDRNCLSGTGLSGTQGSSERYALASEGLAGKQRIAALDGISFVSEGSWTVNTHQNLATGPVSVSAIHLGSARLEGIQFNHLRITSLGAGQ